VGCYQIRGELGDWHLRGCRSAPARLTGLKDFHLAASVTSLSASSAAAFRPGGGGVHLSARKYAAQSPGAPKMASAPIGAERDETPMLVVRPTNLLVGAFACLHGSGTKLGRLPCMVGYPLSAICIEARPPKGSRLLSRKTFAQQTVYSRCSATVRWWLFCALSGQTFLSEVQLTPSTPGSASGLRAGAAGSSAVPVS
jgi:hypothetical protein